MLETDLAVPSGSSLLAQSEQANASPTYADPKDGGSARLEERMKSWSDDFEGYARAARGDMPMSFSCGSGCWRAREGLESLWMMK